MARTRKYSEIDVDRTNRLRLKELVVIKGEGDDTHFSAIHAEETPLVCPKCRCAKIEIKQQMKHVFNDAIPAEDGGYDFIELTYRFYKYRCKDPACRHVFALPVSFADIRKKATHRFTDAVIQSVMCRSYRRLSEDTRSFISPQAIGAAFRKWYQEQDARLKTADEDSKRAAPSCLGVVTAETSNQRFTLFLDCDDEDLRVLDVIPEVGSTRVTDTLAKYDGEKIRCFIIDCEQRMAEHLRTEYPRARVCLPGWFYYDAALLDYESAVRGEVRRPTDEQITLLRTPLEELPERARTYVDFCLLSSQALHDAYDSIAKLRQCLKRPWDYKELFDWAQLIPDTCATYFALSKECAVFFRGELMNGSFDSNAVPKGLYERVSEVRDLLKEFDENTPEVLRARILFLDMKPAEIVKEEPADGQWRGIPMEKVIRNLRILKRTKPERFDRRRKYANQ